MSCRLFSSNATVRAPFAVARQPAPRRDPRAASVASRAMGKPAMTPPTGIKSILIDQETIAARVKEVGRQIATDYADKSPLMISTLKGAVIFTADLVREVWPVPDGLTLEFVKASSYGSGTSSSGKVKVSEGDTDVRGRHIVLLEDIVDSGHTAAALLAHYRAAGAASVRLASLLSKPSRRETPEGEPDYLCFEVADHFVVGYGLDYDQKYRSLPYVAILDESAI